MDLYKTPWLSMVKFIQNLTVKAATDLSIAKPLFINLDAHAEIDEIPSVDFLCLSGWARHMSDKMAEYYVSIGVSTYEDPNMLRHIDLMAIVGEAVEPGKFVPLYDNTLHFGGNLVIGATQIIEPVDRGRLRTLQQCTIHLYTTLTSSVAQSSI